MFTLVTPSLAAGRYSFSFTPRAEGSSFPPAALMRSHFFDRHARTAVHDNRCAGNFLLDFLDDIEMQALFAFEFVGAVAGADGGGERIATGLPNEFDRFVWIRQAGVAFIDLDVFLDAAKLSQLGLDADALWHARDRPRVS